MSLDREYLKFIQDYLNEVTNNKTMPEGMAYQLGFLQGFLAQQMSTAPELAFEFKKQARATLKRQGR